MKKWHYYRFRMQWPDNAEPQWWLDLFVVDTLFRPILSEHRKRIELWRFHRRAARDASGHQTTLLCFMPEAEAARVEALIHDSTALRRLKASGWLREFLYEAGGNRIESSSDPHWSIEIQRSWPYFIAGVSEMVLNLLAAIRAAAADRLGLRPPATPQDIEALYVEVNARLTELWRDEGSHAFFHHLNALFGYAPLFARPRESKGLLAAF